MGGNLANYTFNKGLISSMYREYYSTIIKRQALGAVKGADLKSSHHKAKNIFFFPFGIYMR